MRSARLLLAPLTLAAALTLTACGEEPAASGDRATERGTGTVEGGDATGDGTEPGRERVPVPSRPQPVTLPAAPELTDDAAEAELAGMLGDLAPEEASRAALLYLAELRHPGLADIVRSELLARDGGEYEDPIAAALGLEVLLILGDAEAPAATQELARALLDEEDEVEGIAQALARVPGADADRLLVELAESDYDDVASAAVEALATRGSRAGASVLPGLAADSERLDALRGTAVAALLMTGHERAAGSADALLAGDADASEVVAGFGVPGADATVPYIERIMERAFEEQNADLEFAEACYALAAIFRGTSGAARGRDLVLGWLQRDPDLDGDEATYALWVLGDDTRTAAAAQLLANEVANAARHDPELAVDLLEEVARRGLARDPRFAKAVDAAAVAPPREGLPGLDLATQRLRAAAAYAYLRSR